MASLRDPENTGNKGSGDFTNDALDTNDIPDRAVARRAATACGWMIRRDWMTGMWGTRTW